MKWEVRGAHRQTGRDVVTTIEADSRDRVETIAREEGILISSIEQESTPIVPYATPVQHVEAYRPMPLPQQVVYMAPPQQYARHVQTIEATGKFWKAQIVLSVLLIITGVVFVGIGMNFKGSKWATAAGGGMIAVGFVWFIVARIGAWWCHG